jgi:hypothetical protein
MGCQISPEGSCKFSSKENSSFAGSFMKVSSGILSFLLTEGGEVAGDVFANSFDFGKFRGTS